jgi:mRNA interferase MazF
VVGLAERREAIVCQITSRPYSSAGAIEILETDFADGSLDRVSYARPDKLFTASPTIILSRLGALSDRKTVAVREAVGALFA